MGTPQAGRVVVGVSESITGLGALRRAVAEARLRGVALHAVRAWSLNGSWANVGLAYLRDDLVRETAEITRRAFVAALGAMPTDVPVVATAVEGAAAVALAGYADRDDDLLVVGERGTNALCRLLGRSVAQQCVARATCPVLAVPPTAWARNAHRMARQLRRDVAHLAA